MTSTEIHRLERTRAAVQESRVFGTLDETEIDELIAASELLPVHAGQIVCEEGDPGDHVALVVHGCLAAEAPGPRGPAPLNPIRAGEIYGEMGVLRGAPRSARVVALENGELLIVCQAVFLSLLVRHPAISIRILGSVSDRLHRLTEAFGESVAPAAL